MYKNGRGHMRSIFTFFCYGRATRDQHSFQNFASLLKFHVLPAHVNQLIYRGALLSYLNRDFGVYYNRGRYRGRYRAWFYTALPKGGPGPLFKNLGPYLAKPVPWIELSQKFDLTSLNFKFIWHATWKKGDSWNKTKKSIIYFLSYILSSTDHCTMSYLTTVLIY